MEFDINLVLVPVTLVLLVVWLVDKFALKQHRVAKIANKNLLTVQQQLKSSQNNLQTALKQHQLNGDVDTLVVTDATPQAVKDAHQAYQIAKRDATLAKVNQETAGENVLIRWAYEFLPILLIIVFVRSFVIEPFNIPSSSMVPTLHTGDFVLVDKTSYGLRLPLIHTKILDTGSPERGDVAVFRYPLNPDLYFIKRVIGIPGDTVSYKDGVLSVNGEQVATQKVDHTIDGELLDILKPKQIQNHVLSDDERARLGRKEETFAHYYQETLGEHRYLVRYLGDLNSSVQGEFLRDLSPEVITSEGREWSIKVPENQYFVLGDNRDDSKDSRYWGFVPEDNLSGKATYIWMHKEPGLKLPSFGRAGAID
ncbi:signal peptidase I [Moraxella ovis]|uniref:signal peptidase I n=1 Tax=Moraxella ovis TaxID=29433 RepID=UPI000D9C1F18|nr:signal peptidase I [Moraxella ovis]SPX85478.1 Signal peptidase I [Moraxella ovis]STZ06219.1 Signal peptidase I [Moraxella ovis]